MKSARGRILPTILLPALAASAPLWGAGMVETRGGGDSPFLLWRVVEMSAALRAGIFPVRWMADGACGLGYPFFNYYAALPYYLAGGLHLLGVPILVAIQAVQTLGMLLAAFTFYHWISGHLQKEAARWLAVAAYTFAPFHLVNLYVRGDSLSEFFAFVWYPLILWTLDRLAKAPSPRRIAATALAYAALIITHNVSALIFTPFALSYALLLAFTTSTETFSLEWKKSAIRLVALILLPFALGLLLSAWFWLPALAEIDYGQLGEAFTAGYFHYDRHFRGWNLVQKSLGFDYRIASTGETAGPFAMGLVQALLALLGAIALLAQRRGDRLWRHFLLGGGALATVMITPLSAPLWDHIELLAKTQFPWRFLSVQALFTAALSGVLVEGLSHPRSRRAAAVILIALQAIAVLAPLHPERLLITDAEVRRDRLLFYESFTANLGTTIRYEYLPRDVVPRLYISELVLDGQGALRAEGAPPPEGEKLHATPRGQVWHLALEKRTRVVFPLNAWPGWRAWIDGRPAAWRAEKGSGRLAIEVPAGEHEVELRLGETPLRRFANGLSLAAWVFLLSLLSRGLWGRGARTTFAHLGGLMVPALLLPWLLHHFAPLPPSATLFDFIHSPWPHHGVADFGVLRAEIAPMEVVAHGGDRLTVPLRHLEGGDGLTVTLRLVSPAEPRHGISATLSEESFSAIATPSAWTVQVPEGVPRGLYLVNLRVADAHGPLTARSPQGQPLGDLYIGIVRLLDGPPAPADVVASYPDLKLHALEARQRSAEELDVGMVWSAPEGTPRNWSLSLRLHDLEGRTLAQWDGQPGYGYQPTTLWRPGEAVSTTVALPLPYGTAPGSYRLEIITYLEATMGDGASATFPVTLTQASLWNSREEHCPLVRKGLTLHCPAGDLFLKKVEMPERVVEGEPLEFIAEWTAIATPKTAVRVRWMVVDGRGTIVAEREGLPAVGSDARRWPRFALVRAPVRLEMPPILDRPPYHLALTVIAGGRAYRCEMEDPLSIEQRARLFTPPLISHPLEATFGGVIRLLGYDLTREEGKLELTLWWQAVEPPGRDYKRFVHLYDAAGHVLTQSDAMPRDWGYPTSWWAAGEVVSETVRLDESAGSTALGIGWYDPQTMKRLHAVDAAGNPLPDDRLPVPLEQP